MELSGVIQTIRTSGRVSRKAWGESWIEADYIDNGTVSLLYVFKSTDGAKTPWRAEIEDLSADDWQIDVEGNGKELEVKGLKDALYSAMTKVAILHNGYFQMNKKENNQRMELVNLAFGKSKDHNEKNWRF